MENDEILAYLAFQGGGAKGISHIGGLAAVNELKLKIGGVAGTSAGAIIAALVAAKYSANKIFDGKHRRHILRTLSYGDYANPTTLFGEKGWRSLQKVIALKDDIARIIRWTFHGCWHQRLRVAVGVTFFVSLVVLLSYICPRTELVLWLIALCLLTWRGYTVYRGLCSLDAVRKIVDEAIARELQIANKNKKRGQNITFSCLKSSGGLPLKLVATNVTDGGLELFSYETTPDVVIADAVCASICIPFIFKRWRFSFERKGEKAVEREFIDGGLMSNLPSWSFDEERALNQQAVTIGFGLQGAEEEKSGKELLRGANETKSNKKFWLMSALNAVIAGPPQIHLRGINRLIYVPLESPLKLLDFDATFDQFKAAIEKAKDVAYTVINAELTGIPTLVHKLLKQMQDEVGEKVTAKYRNGKRQGTAPEFRVALAIQRPTDFSTLSVAYAEGQYSTPWSGMRVSLENSPVGIAWNQRAAGEPDFEFFEQGSKSTDKVFADSGWMSLVPVPIYDPLPDELRAANLAVVLVIDSPYMLGTLKDNEKDVAAFAGFLHENVVEHVKAQDLGRLVRRSVSWL
jgi:NTE family protein